MLAFYRGVPYHWLMNGKLIRYEIQTTAGRRITFALSKVDAIRKATARGYTVLAAAKAKSLLEETR